ncbi:oxidoreductase [Periconia macrospinosa]|uniref:Oxidoreductase n=1 Tax=Periconia macrospinosa TaxID=97972 RepID=A0A2V1DFT6_9PLEO|nr:oxidoreductase [Periconia macrospinosa]
MINLGVIGTGWITSSFVRSAQSTSSYTLRAVYSRSLETAETFASKHASSSSSSSSSFSIKTYTSIADLVNDADIDTVYIASPNILHFTQAKESLTAGKNVILEKPSCSTVDQLDQLFALAQSKKVFLLEAWRHIQEPNFKTLKTAIDTHLGGRASLHSASLHYEQFSSRFDKLLAGELPNIFNLEMGGGALVDLGIYTVAAAIWLFGTPASSRYFPTKLSSGADGGGHLILTYDDNFVVHLSSSKMHNSTAPSEIYSHRGTLSVPTITDVQGVTFWDPRAKKREVLAGEDTAVEKGELNLSAEAREFARIIGERDWEAAGQLEVHSREVLRVVERARRENGLRFPGEE